MCAARDPLADVRAELVRLHEEVGSPTYDELLGHAARLGLNLPTSTTHDLLTGMRLARWETVRRFVVACREHAASTRSNVPAVCFDLKLWQARYNAGDAAGPSRPLPRASFYSDVIDAFRADHADADWGDTVDDLLARFTADPGFYVVAGEAYAGKTALTTKLHYELERRHVPAVVFYVVQHEADRPIHYLPAVITQLLAVLAARDDGYTSITLEQTPERQLLQYEELWRECASGPEPVFLLVDGIDERAVIRGEVGVTGLIPRSAGTHGRVVLTTRPNPTLDLPRAHPLSRRLDLATHVLTPSPQAHAGREVVERELAVFLRSEDARCRDLAGLVAMAGAPLSDREVAELLDLPGPGVSAAMREPIARSLFIEPASDGTPRFRFAHREIRMFVEEELGRDGASGTHAVVAQVLRWADRYAEAGWPSHTPRFLREHLPTFIASRATPKLRGRRLTMLLHDDYRRLTRMVSGNDRIFFQLLELTRNTVAADADVGTDPAEAFMVETWSAELTAFNQTASYTTLAALARAGLHAQALDGARLIPNAERRAHALTDLVAVLHELGMAEPLRSAQRALADAVSELKLNSVVHHDVLVGLVRAALAVGDPEAVWSALDAVSAASRSNVAQASAQNVPGVIMADLAVEFARSELAGVPLASFLRRQALLHQAAGSPDHELNSLLTGMPEQATRAAGAQLRARRESATGMPAGECLSWFEGLSPLDRARELAAFATFLADHDLDNAVVAARAAHAHAAALRPDEPAWWSPVITAGEVYARAGLLDAAADAARTIADARENLAIWYQPTWGWVYDEMACWLARSCRLDEARELLGRTSQHPMKSLAALVRAAAESGQLQAALAIVSDFDSTGRAPLYLGIVEGLCHAGKHEQAQDVALRSVLDTSTDSEPRWLTRVYRPLCEELIAIGRLDHARRAADQVREQWHHKQLVGQIAASAGTRKPSSVFATAWTAARKGDPASSAVTIQEVVDPALRCQLAALEAFRLHRLGRPKEATAMLDAIAGEIPLHVASAGLLLAEAFRAEPGEKAYWTCANHLVSEQVVGMLRKAPALRYWCDHQVMRTDRGVVLKTDESRAPFNELSALLLYHRVLFTACRSLLESARSRGLVASDGAARDGLDDVELLEIAVKISQADQAMHPAHVPVYDSSRAQALSNVLPLLPDLSHDRLWALGGQFDQPLHRVRAATRAVATALTPSSPDYHRSVRRLFDEVRKITDVHERWEALGHVGIGLLPVSPECLDHHLSRSMSRTTS